MAILSKPHVFGKGESLEAKTAVLNSMGKKTIYLESYLKFSMKIKKLAKMIIIK